MALVRVTFDWDDRHGECHDCGLPAAYLLLNGFGPGEHVRTCCVCAADYAADGCSIRRIEPTEDVRG